ncbi:uroporphyrinogen decarboxylase [Maritalea porphyrae]|uniref:uroporphyrinogen decarboxylase n=1 Tax=Maritalea porphyrae TaxID=880732 RepID=UPI0022AFE598|nr:uroporphyrinogen decarboxylase [Maritalea porphyrae]MCZ4272256.1 uroporphyrinogen decarboxylase [Maritalea porphyrae]
MVEKTGRKLLDCVRGFVDDVPPMWIMRQAGRYLPEYREVRASTKGFLDLCYTPQKAIEVTLQPLRRFDLDAAILFSDILVIPDALGQDVRFEVGEGPILTEIENANDLAKLDVSRVLEHLAPVLETVRGVRATIDDDKTLIGFCGAPWTVATYMLGGRGSPDQAKARLFALAHPDLFAQLMDILVEASAQYLLAQLDAGADVVQIFESWALNLDEVNFENFVVKPTVKLVNKVRAVRPDAPIIGFPRGAATMIPGYIKATGVNAVGLDYAMPLAYARDNISPLATVQGNLDPLRLVSGGKQMLDRADEIVTAFKGRPHIFNLGHGIVPQTPIENVEALVNHVKGH